MAKKNIYDYNVWFENDDEPQKLKDIELEIADEYIEEAFEEMYEYNDCPINLDLIFEVASNDYRYFLPHIKTDKDWNIYDYFDKWINKYTDSLENMPSSNIKNPKSTCTDPAVKLLLQTAKDIDDDDADEYEAIHNLFMSAENAQGNLLEEYIASKVTPYGWIWCCGEVLKAVDFCTEDGSILLQIKNKHSTENSSSGKIRLGTSIKKWHRLSSQTRKGIYYPVFNWEKLNAIINSYNYNRAPHTPCRMTEVEYQQFLIEVAYNNPDIITDK